jgi:uncharacterized protein YuzE
MIGTRYDPEADVLHVAFGAPGAVYDCAQEVAAGVYVEFDQDGRPMGVEITGARWISEGRPGALVAPAAAE